MVPLWKNISMGKTSAGLLMYRVSQGALEVLLAHPGGPFWRNKDEGAWSIPKGETDGEEELLAAAKREFFEETGITPKGEFIALGSVKLKSGKMVRAWAFEGDCDTSRIQSNMFAMEWPPKSGKMQQVAEIDKAEFFTLAVAREKINSAQVVFLERLEETFE